MDKLILVIVILICILLLIIAFIVQSRSQANQTKRELQGIWEDINSGTILEVKGSKLSLTYSDYTNTYRYKIAKKDQNFRITSAGEGGNFGSIEYLVLSGDVITAKVNADLRGLHYYFVREDKVSEAKKIKDLSVDAPKDFESTEIKHFKLTFGYDGDGEIGEDEHFLSGNYTWEIIKEGINYESTLTIEYAHMHPPVFEEYTLSFDEVGIIQAEIERQKLYNLNGYHKMTLEKTTTTELAVKYVSGEVLSIKARGGAVREYIFDIRAFMNIAREIGVYTGDYELPE